MKLFESRWDLVNRCDGIEYKRHVKQLRHRRQVSHQMSDRVEELGQSDILMSEKDENIGKK